MKRVVEGEDRSQSTLFPERSKTTSQKTILSESLRSSSRSHVSWPTRWA